jgi:hypothetical protein
MNVAEKLNKVNNELDALRAEYKKLGDKIGRKVKEQEKLMLVLNADNLKDHVWLLRNPTMPGVYEATKELWKDLYGGNYIGPHIMGYHHDDKYNPIQASVHFCLETYSNSDTREKVKENCEHFIQNFLSSLDPVIETASRYSNKFPKIKVVPFQFCSEERGLDYLGYCPADQKWYHFTMRYGCTNTERVFENWDAAFNFAYEMSNRKYKDDDY